MTVGSTTAVVVHWGPAEPTCRVAEGLAAAGVVDRVFVVANDRSVRPAGLDPGVEWVDPGRNLGYAGALEALRGRHRADRWLLVNNDVSLPAATVAALVGVMADRPEVGIAAPVLMRPGGAPQSGVGTFTRVLGRPVARRAPVEEVEACHWVTGAVIGILDAVLDDVPIDTRYFLGYEDTDLCVRARAAGWGVVVLRDAAVHLGGGTMLGPRWQYYVLRNRLWFLRKNRRWRHYALTAAWFALFLLPRVAVADVVKRRGRDRTRGALRGLIDGLRPAPRDNVPRADEPVPAAWMAW